MYIWRSLSISAIQAGNAEVRGDKAKQELKKELTNILLLVFNMLDTKGKVDVNLGLSFEDTGDYLHVRVRSEWIRKEIIAGIRNFAEKAQSAAQTRILLDICELSSPGSELDRFMVGEAIAKFFPSPMKTVAVPSYDFIDKFAENVAVNRGANFMVYSDFDEAVSWLTGVSA